MKRKKRRRLKRFLFALAAVMLIWWFNNYTLKITEVNIEDEKISNEITLVQLTDLHGASFSKGNKTLIKKVESLSPDIVLITGDMFTHPDEDSTGSDTALDLMAQLAKKYKVCYVNGEHDDSEPFFERLRAAGVTVMNYEEQLVTVKDTKLHIYGIDNVYFPSGFDLHNAFEPDDKNFTVLLSHSQNFKKFAEFGIDLTLCGDTHGGIFRLPFVGAVADDDGFFPDRSGRYTKGLYNLGDSRMFISSGLGNYPLPVRFFNRPEIAVIKLLPKK